VTANTRPCLDGSSGCMYSFSKSLATCSTIPTDVR
jgi:hypothetical protein